MREQVVGRKDDCSSRNDVCIGAIVNLQVETFCHLLTYRFPIMCELDYVLFLLPLMSFDCLKGQGLVRMG